MCREAEMQRTKNNLHENDCWFFGSVNNFAYFAWCFVYSGRNAMQILNRIMHVKCEKQQISIEKLQSFLSLAVNILSNVNLVVPRHFNGERKIAPKKLPWKYVEWKRQRTSSRIRNWILSSSSMLLSGQEANTAHVIVSIRLTMEYELANWNA